MQGSSGEQAGLPFNQGGDVDFVLDNKEPEPEFKVGHLVDSPVSKKTTVEACVKEEITSENLPKL